MMRDDDPVRVKVKTPIALMIGRIPQENTQGGTRR